MTKSEAHDVGEKEVHVMIDITVLLVFTKTTRNGIAAGASLDQSIKQLPVRHRIGVVAYSAYS